VDIDRMTEVESHDLSMNNLVESAVVEDSED